MPMSIIRQWKESEDRRHAEESARRELNDRIAELKVHPLVRLGLDRNVRESYFYGLVFSAICDDLRIDELEEELLSKIGSAINLDSSFVSDAIEMMRTVDNASKLALFKEALLILRGITSESLKILFAAEYAKVRLLHPENEADLHADFDDIEKELGVPVVADLDILKAIIKAGCYVSIDAIDLLAALIGDMAAEYFVVGEVGNVEMKLARFRLLLHLRGLASVKEENYRSLAYRITEIIEGDASWPVTFNTSMYECLFSAAGVQDAARYVGAVIGPKLKDVLSRAKNRLGAVRVLHHGNWGARAIFQRNSAGFEREREAGKAGFSCEVCTCRGLK